MKVTRRSGRRSVVFPPRQAQAVALYYFEDYSVRDIAAVLDCSEGSVKTHLSRARASVARHLQLEDPDERLRARARHAADAVRRQIAECPLTMTRASGAHSAARPEVRFRLAVAASTWSVLWRSVYPCCGPASSRVGDSAASGGGVTSGGAGAASGRGVRPSHDGCVAAVLQLRHLLQYFTGGGTRGPDRPGGRRPSSLQPRTSEDRGPPRRRGRRSAAGAPAHSDTNIQEAGVDEPDIVKTDGRRIVAVAQGRVHLISWCGGAHPQKALPGSTARNVFLSGNRLLVFSDEAAEGGETGSPWFGAQATLTMYDISRLSDPDSSPP